MFTNLLFIYPAVISLTSENVCIKNKMREQNEKWALTESNLKQLLREEQHSTLKYEQEVQGECVCRVSYMYMASLVFVANTPACLLVTPFFSLYRSHWKNQAYGNGTCC